LETTTQFAWRLHQRLHPLRDAGDLDPLLERVGDALCVLLGEASHGTLEYYVWRARISERLICEKTFSFIAVEGAWPDCYEVIAALSTSSMSVPTSTLTERGSSVPLRSGRRVPARTW
jgi:erythromycin esterase